MCGIAGIMHFNRKPVIKEELACILNKIAHRGRDHHGIVLGGRGLTDSKSLSQSVAIGLGHRRLSIIDLDESASQPFFYANNTLCISYNGEIYNYLELKDYLKKKSYVFTTHSDTEVLLAAYHYWGQACVKHLNGMFAFAIWDENKRLLFCARDHLGIKPLYFYLTQTTFAFASESYALSHLTQKKINEDALLTYLLSMYVATNESIFAEIQKLPPGHTLVVKSDGQTSIEKFWSINAFAKNKATHDTLNTFDALIHQAIKRQLQSDVPVGGFLSGGVDSGLITAIAAPLSHYHTYSIGYEGMDDNELPHANEIAQRYRTHHTAVMLTAQDALITLNKALAQLSEPIADSAMVATYLLSELAAADGVKVLLNGTGGDEIFAGYTRYSGQLSLKRKFIRPFIPVIQKFVRYFPIELKTKSRLRFPALDMIFSTGGSYNLAYAFSNGKSHFSSFLSALAESFTFPAIERIPLTYQQMLFDMRFYLPEELLYLLDQMTMAHTVEGRVPLLDIDIVQAAFNCHVSDHLQNGQTKSLLKKIATPYLGKNHVSRKKQGFAGTTSWWVKKNYSEMMEVVRDLKKLSYFTEMDIDQMHPKTHVDNDRAVNDANDIFILYCFGKWHEKLKAQ